MRARAATAAASVRGLGVADAVGPGGAGRGWCDPPQPASSSAAVAAQTRPRRTGQVNHVNGPPHGLRDFRAVPESVLSDGTTRRLVDAGRIVIKPWDPALVQPASIDLR